MDKKTKIIIILFAAAAVFGLLLYLLTGNMGGTVATITVDGEEYESIDLSRVEQPYDIEIRSGYGLNIVHVQPGAIGVTHASCPDKVCVRQGSISGPGIPVVCLPNRLVIIIEGGELDG